MLRSKIVKSIYEIIGRDAIRMPTNRKGYCIIAIREVASIISAGIILNN